MAVALLAGCAVGPDYEQPQVPSPTAFGSADAAVYGAAEPALAWWQTLDDPLLHEWLEAALLQNHDLRIAETNLRAARAVLGARKLERYPIATSQLSALEQEQSAAVALAPDRDQRIYDVSLDATWELDFFGRVRRSVQAATADANAATEALRDTFVIVSAELARTYFELKGASFRLSVAQQNAENQRQTFELTQALLAGGRGTDLDIARARAQLESTLATHPAARERYQQRRAPPGRAARPTAGDVRASAGRRRHRAARAAASARYRRTRGHAAQARRRALRGVRVASRNGARRRCDGRSLSARLVCWDPSGYVATSASDLGDGDTRTTRFGPFLSWPAFDLGRVRANIRVANADMDAALLRYEQTVLIALEETENALFGFTSARTRQARLEVAAEASQQAADLARVRYREGVDSFLTVLDAERRLLEVQDELARSSTDTALAFVLLYKALGGGWEAVDERLQAAN